MEQSVAFHIFPVAMTAKQFAATVCVIAACGYGTAAHAQVTQPTLASILGAYSGHEPAFTDVEGDLTGPSNYIFHFLPNGKAFMDWTQARNGASGRTFGVYSATAGRKGIKVRADFFPSMDSAAVEPPATDYFETFTFWFSDKKVNVRYADAPKAPMFLVSRVGLRKRLTK